MIPHDQRLPAGYCAHCRVECRDCLGSEIYPHRPDLADKIIWRCALCGARVGSHPKGEPLGTAANEELRRARELLHGRLDPIWKDAHRHPAYAMRRDQSGPEDQRKRLAIIRRTARVRTYAFLAARMELTKEECHVALFDIVDCREAWLKLGRVTYDDVRRWHKDLSAKKEAGQDD